MKKLDLYKLWQIINTLSEKQSELSEKSIYVSFLGNKSNYISQSFESFLEYYSFKIEKDNIMVFNDDKIPHEDYTNDDFSYVPFVLISLPVEKLNNWIEIEIDLELKRQEIEKQQLKEYIKRQIELLTKKLNNYA